MPDNDTNRFRMNVSCEGAPPLRLLGLTGRDEVGAPFELQLVVEPLDRIPLSPVEIDALFDGATTLSFGPENDHPMYGVIRGVRMLHTPDGSGARYQLLMVPKLWDARYTRGSYVFLDLALPALIEAALDADVLTSGEDYELALQEDWYPTREFTMQYEEDDLSFVTRKAEHHGVTFCFEHADGKAKALFLDSNTSFAQLEGFDKVSFRPRDSHTDTIESEVVFELEVAFQRTSQCVKLVDFNDRIPSVDMTVDAECDAAGWGHHHRANDHYATPSEGAILARLRVEQLYGENVRLRAKSRLRGIRAGHRFELVDHPLGLDQELIVLAVEHHYERGAAGGGTYHNELLLQPYRAPFRPALRTPVPVVHGVIPGKIDSESGDHETDTPLDEHGRYKVRLPFVVNGEEGGKASCWIRMSSSSAGPGHGLHVPLHLGTEVAVFFVGGNPDRPIIAGAVPNTETASPVNAQNPNESMIRTRGGISFRMSD